MKTEAKSLREQIVQIMWYMRGSVTMEEAWHLPEADRRVMIKLIEGNIERTKKAQMPLL